MGETALVRPDETARAMVGSCVGLVLYDPRCKLAAVAHIVLPASAERNGAPGKFADTAIPHLLALLDEQGVRQEGVIAKMAGGAQMFGGRPGSSQDRDPATNDNVFGLSADGVGPWQIGEANVHAVTNILAELAIPIQGRSVGGTKGRKLSFCCDSGEMTIEVAGQVPSIH